MGDLDGYGVYLTSEEFRRLLNDAYKIKRDGRCTYCNGTGYQNWDELGGDIKPGKSPNVDRCDGVCEECGGLGFNI